MYYFVNFSLLTYFTFNHLKLSLCVFIKLSLFEKDILVADSKNYYLANKYFRRGAPPPAKVPSSKVSKTSQSAAAVGIETQHYNAR